MTSFSNKEQSISDSQDNANLSVKASNLPKWVLVVDTKQKRQLWLEVSMLEHRTDHAIVKILSTPHSPRPKITLLPPQRTDCGHPKSPKQQYFKIYKAMMTISDLQVFQQLCNQGSLQSLFLSLRQIPESEGIQIMNQLINGCKLIQHYFIVADDLKPSSLLISNQLQNSRLWHTPSFSQLRVGNKVWWAMHSLCGQCTHYVSVLNYCNRTQYTPEVTLGPSNMFRDKGQSQVEYSRLLNNAQSLIQANGQKYQSYQSNENGTKLSDVTSACLSLLQIYLLYFAFVQQIFPQFFLYEVNLTIILQLSIRFRTNFPVRSSRTRLMVIVVLTSKYMIRVKFIFVCSVQLVIPEMLLNFFLFFIDFILYTIFLSRQRYAIQCLTYQLSICLNYPQTRSKQRQTNEGLKDHQHHKLQILIHNHETAKQGNTYRIDSSSFQEGQRQDISGMFVGAVPQDPDQIDALQQQNWQSRNTQGNRDTNFKKDGSQNVPEQKQRNVPRFDASKPSDLCQ